MSRHVISIILSGLFLVFVAAPTIIKMVDDSIDISFYYSYAEEEEKGSAKNKNTEILASDDLNNESNIHLDKKENNTTYVFKNYSKPYLNLLFPPPDLNII